MGLSVIASGLMKQKLKSDIAAFNKKLGIYRDEDSSIMKIKDSMLRAKLTYFENIRTKSDAALFLLFIPEFLPEGTWIERLDITYDDSSAFVVPVATTTEGINLPNANDAKAPPTLTVTLEGFAYSENKNDQFRLINTLLRNLKDSKEFSSFFEDINLETTQAQKLEEYSVTSFKVICMQHNGPKKTSKN